MEAGKRPPEDESEGPNSDRSSYPKGSSPSLSGASADESAEELGIPAGELLSGLPRGVLADYLATHPTALEGHPEVLAVLLNNTPGREAVRANELQLELARMELREQAKELFDAARRPPAEPFDAGTLAEILARPVLPAARVDGLVPWNASTLLVAQRKAGKTTLCLNLAYSLITGEPFLGTFGVRPVTGRVAFLNFEVSGHTVAGWAQKRGVPSDRLFVVNLRGRPNPFRSPAELDTLAELLRAQDVETLIVDPFGRAYSGESQNDNGEVNHWLLRLDEFARSGVGAKDIILAAHSGWNPERSRGASALEDWPDSIMTLTRDEKSDLRFLRADGRDVSMSEDQLTWDPSTGGLAISGQGSRKVAQDEGRIAELMSKVLDAVRRAPGIKTGDLETALKDEPMQNGDVSKAARKAEELGLLVRKTGPRNAKLHYLANQLREGDKK